MLSWGAKAERKAKVYDPSRWNFEIEDFSYFPSDGWFTISTKLDEGFGCVNFLTWPRGVQFKEVRVSLSILGYSLTKKDEIICKKQMREKGSILTNSNTLYTS